MAKQLREKKISLHSQAEVPFHNAVDFCVGTGRMGLALTEEYLKELKMVQDEIGFQHIRGHGLFTDDVAIYHEYEEDGVTKVEYNYTYLDRIFDRYQELHIRPFLELGFMPSKLASGTQTVFYWKGNTTPPKDYSMWCDMVVALLKHLVGRYGEEVYEWPIEVWNEPNLPGFWEKADMQEYFKLFEASFRAIKALDTRFQVGGPAVCGVQDELWIRSFMEFCKEKDLHPDSVTRHHYTVEFPDRIGHYDYSKLMNFEDGFTNLQSTRDIIDSFPEYKGLPIHITEFSTSYTPRGVIHDTNLNAACIAEQLSRLGDVNESYSYWTFGDVFEEQGVQFSLFHGGFGLVADGCIPKPTFWTFSFYKQLKKRTISCLHRDANSVLVKTEKGYAGILWNRCEEDFEMHIELPEETGSHVLITKTVDELVCNPLKFWHDLGEPAQPTKEEMNLIRAAAQPALESKILTDEQSITIPVRHNGVVYFEINARQLTADRGYDYEKVVTYCES